MLSLLKWENLRYDHRRDRISAYQKVVEWIFAFSLYVILIINLLSPPLPSSYHRDPTGRLTPPLWRRAVIPFLYQVFQGKEKQVKE